MNSMDNDKIIHMINNTTVYVENIYTGSKTFKDILKEYVKQNSVSNIDLN